MDMNSDLGEGFGAWRMGDDAAVLSRVSSANIACGFHAGDPSIMRATVGMCARAGVAVGAHVAYPDLLGFGRRAMKCEPREVYDYCLYQIGALSAFCRAQGTRLVHVTPHGALYHQAAADKRLADAVAGAARDAGEGLILVGLAGSESERAAREIGLPFAAEAFADRGYNADGTLMPRGESGAVIHDPELAASRVVRMASEGVVEAGDGSEIHLSPDTICLHGDTPEAVGMAEAVRRALERAGVKVAPLDAEELSSKRAGGGK
jgi:UPF0271 protein